MAQYNVLSKSEKDDIGNLGPDRIKQVLKSYWLAAETLDLNYDFSIDELKKFEFDDIRDDRRFCGIVVSGGNLIQGSPKLIVGDDHKSLTRGTEPFLQAIPADQELLKISGMIGDRETVWSSRCDPLRGYVSFEINSQDKLRVADYGTIRVNSVPEGAKIILNSIEFSRPTNVQLLYPAGKVSLIVAKDGYQTHEEEEFELSRDQIYGVNATLQPNRND